MSPNLVPKLIELWLAVSVGALLVLAVLSYLAAKFLLDGVELFDRWLSRPNCKHRSDLELNEAPHLPKSSA